ncbi:putative leader peptide [Peterkaempfera sp. SMS 1(5)a]
MPCRPLLTRRSHVDLRRTASAVCSGAVRMPAAAIRAAARRTA